METQMYLCSLLHLQQVQSFVLLSFQYNLCCHFWKNQNSQCKFKIPHFVCLYDNQIFLIESNHDILQHFCGGKEENINMFAAAKSLDVQYIVNLFVYPPLGYNVSCVDLVIFVCVGVSDF